MAAASLSSTRLPCSSRLLSPSWATTRPTILPVYASGGKGFGEILNRRKNKGKEKEVPATSLSPSRGFGNKQNSQQNDESEASPDASIHSENDQTVCSCGGGDENLSYTECCMPYHQGTAAASDGLSLLRARFSAYARGIVGFIVSTTHPESPDCGDNLTANAQATCDQLRFYKLEILQYEPISDQESTVSFRVTYGRRRKGQGDRRVLEEKSHFVREGDTWLFKDGEVLRRSSEAELLAAATIANQAGKSWLQSH